MCLGKRFLAEKVFPHIAQAKVGLRLKIIKMARLIV